MRATAISTDPRDGHEMLRLLLQPWRSLCASTGHYPHLPSQEVVQPTTARVTWSRDSFPGRTHGTLQAAATSCQPLPPLACPAFCTPPSPRLSEPEPPNQLLLEPCPVWAKNRWPQATYTQRGSQIRSWTPGAVWTRKRKGNLFQQPQEQWIKSPQSIWCTLHLWNTWIDNESSQNWDCGLWEKRYIYIFPFSLIVSMYVYASLCDFCLYSFAFTICPMVLSVRFFLFNNYFLF